MITSLRGVVIGKYWFYIKWLWRPNGVLKRQFNGLVDDLWLLIIIDDPSVVVVDMQYGIIEPLETQLVRVQCSAVYCWCAPEGSCNGDLEYCSLFYYLWTVGLVIIIVGSIVQVNGANAGAISLAVRVVLCNWCNTICHSLVDIDDYLESHPRQVYNILPLIGCVVTNKQKY